MQRNTSQQSKERKQQKEKGSSLNKKKRGQVLHYRISIQPYTSYNLPMLPVSTAQTNTLDQTFAYDGLDRLIWANAKHRYQTPGCTSFPQCLG
mgnify:FL=1